MYYSLKKIQHTSNDIQHTLTNIAHTSKKIVHTYITHQTRKEVINIINNTRIVIDNDKLYIIADINLINSKQDFLSECLKHYQLSNEISINDIEVKRVTIQSVIKQSQDASSQRIRKQYKFTNLNLGTTVYALQLK